MTFLVCVFTLLQGLSGGFTPETAGQIGCPSFLFPFDLNEDGRQDILCAAWDDSAVVVLENLPQGWNERQLAEGLHGATSVCAGFFNDDGIPDLAATAWEEAVICVLYGTSSGDYESEIIAYDQPMAHEVTACDINGDGKTDLTTAVAGLNRISLWLNGGGPNPDWTEIVIAEDMGGARSVCCGDLDGNGTVDVAAAALTSDCVRWWSNQGGETPQFVEHSLIENMNGAHMVRAAHLDDDGVLDLAAVGYFSGEVAIWLSSTGHEKQTIESSFPGALGVALADFDDDGKVDIAATSETTGTVRWWRNTGAGAPWTWQNVDTALPGAWPVNSGDFNNDGRPDLTAGAGFGQAVRCYINDGTAGIEHDRSPSEVLVFPNPATSHTEISMFLSSPCNVRMELFDTSGRRVWEREVVLEEESSFHLNTSSLPPGVYLLACAVPDRTRYTRFSVIS